MDDSRGRCGGREQIDDVAPTHTLKPASMGQWGGNQERPLIWALRRFVMMEPDPQHQVI